MPARNMGHDRASADSAAVTTMATADAKFFEMAEAYLRIACVRVRFSSVGTRAALAVQRRKNQLKRASR